MVDLDWAAGAEACHVSHRQIMCPALPVCDTSEQAAEQVLRETSVTQDVTVESLKAAASPITSSCAIAG